MEGLDRIQYCTDHSVGEARRKKTRKIGKTEKIEVIVELFGGCRRQYRAMEGDEGGFPTSCF